MDLYDDFGLLRQEEFAHLIAMVAAPSCQQQREIAMQALVAHNQAALNAICTLQAQQVIRKASQ